MKFYINSYLKIKENKLTAIDFDYYYTRFFKNGVRNNNKNAAIIHILNYKQFYLNDKYYGNQNDLTRKSWRRFVKMQAFL